MSETTAVAKAQSMALTADDIKEMKEDGTSMAFIPQLKITYPVSGHFGEDGSKQGDFFLDGKCLGESIVCHALPAAKYLLSAFKDNEFLGKLSLVKKSGTRMSDRPEIAKFLEDNGKENCDEGWEMLIYIPETNQFGTFHCKKTFKSAAGTLADLSQNGGLVNFGTTEKVSKAKRKYYLPNITAVDGTVELPSNTPEVIEVFLSDVVTDEGAADESTRER